MSKRPILSVRRSCGRGDAFVFTEIKGAVVVKRQQRSAKESNGLWKRRLVPGDSIAHVAPELGVIANQVFQCRYEDGKRASHARSGASKTTRSYRSNSEIVLPFLEHCRDKDFKAGRSADSGELLARSAKQRFTSSMK